MIKLILILIALLGTPVYFDTHIVSVFDIPKVTVLYISSIGLMVVWIFQSKPFSALRNIPLRYPIIAYLSSFILSSTLSLSPITSLIGEYKRYDGLISTFCYLILFYSIASITFRKHIYIILYAMIGMSVPIAIYGIFQHYGHDYWWWDTFDGNRVPSTFGNPAFFAQYLIMLIPIAISLYFEKGWLYLPVILLLLVTFSFTASRAASIGLLIGIIFFGYFTYRKVFVFKNKLKITVLAALLIGSILTLLAINSFAHYIPITKIIGRFHENAALERRLSTWRTGIEIVKDYSMFGVGPDCIGLVYQKELDKHFKLTKANGGFPYEQQDRLHADILDTLATRGIFGLGAYIWLLVSFGILIKKYFSVTWPVEKMVVSGLLAGLLAWFIQNQVVFSLCPINTMFWSMLGLCVSLSRLLASQYSVS